MFRNVFASISNRSTEIEFYFLKMEYWFWVVIEHTKIKNFRLLQKDF